MQATASSDFVKVGASAMARTATKNPLVLLATIVDAHPAESADWLFRTWQKAVRADDELLEPVMRHTFTNLLSQLDRPVVMARRSAETAQRSASIQREAQDIARRVTTVVLMNLQLPNGKQLRDATFKDCAAAGGFFSLVARKGKPMQIVGKTMTEDDLRTLYER